MGNTCEHFSTWGYILRVPSLSGNLVPWTKVGVGIPFGSMAL